MKMFVQADNGAMFEVVTKACGGKECSMFCKRCGEEGTPGKEPCQKFIDFIETIYYAAYGFKRVKGGAKLR